MEDDNDPIIEEYDLFLSSEMAQKCFIAQFPLISRKGYVPNLEQISFDKEKNTYHINLSPAYDLFSGSEHKPLTLYASKISTSQPLALGVIRDNQIHLTPVTTFYQARPMDSEQLKSETISTEAVDFVPISNLNKFISANSTSIASDMHSSVYKDILTGMKCEFSSDLLDSIDESNLSSYPPKEQLFYILLKEKSILFDDVLKRLGLSAYSDDLIEIVLNYSYFVCGRWVLKSEQFKESELQIGHRIARNFIIVLFANQIELSQNKNQKFRQLFDLKLNLKKKMVILLFQNQ